MGALARKGGPPLLVVVLAQPPRRVKCPPKAALVFDTFPIFRVFHQQPVR